jgi:hypothetical protein
MKFAAGLLAGIALVAAASVSPRVTRDNVATLERLTDGKVVQLDANTPGEALGRTRGVYLEGYGAVFTAEVDPNPFAAPNPFRPAYTPAEVDKLHIQKQTRIEVLQKRMVESMVVIAQNLKGVPATERIALAVTIPYYPWEKTTGMPRQILIEAQKSALLNPGTLNESLKVEKF